MMLFLDNNVLSEYVRGKDSAAEFLDDYDDEEWAICSIVLYEALEAAIHGYIDLNPATLKEYLTASLEIVDVTERTATEAQALQRQLMDRGVQAENPDVLIVAAATEHGGTFATAEKLYWRDDVQDVIDVAEFDPY